MKHFVLKLTLANSTALLKDNIKVVQASLLGSVLVNLLLVLGSAIIAGGVTGPDQTYNNDLTHAFVGLLNLTVSCLMIPVCTILEYFMNPVLIISECILRKREGRRVRGSHVTLLQQRRIDHPSCHILSLSLFSV